MSNVNWKRICHNLTALWESISKEQQKIITEQERELLEAFKGFLQVYCRIMCPIRKQWCRKQYNSSFDF